MGFQVQQGSKARVCLACSRNHLEANGRNVRLRNEIGRWVVHVMSALTDGGSHWMEQQGDVSNLHPKKPHCGYSVEHGGHAWNEEAYLGAIAVV